MSTTETATMRGLLASVETDLSALRRQQASITRDILDNAKARDEAIMALLEAEDYSPTELVEWALTVPAADEVLRDVFRAASPYIREHTHWYSTDAAGWDTDVYGSLGAQLTLFEQMSDEAVASLAEALSSLLAKHQPEPTRFEGGRGYAIVTMLEHQSGGEDADYVGPPVQLHLYADGTAAVGHTDGIDPWDDDLLDEVKVGRRDFESLAAALAYAREHHWYEQSDRRADPWLA